MGGGGVLLLLLLLLFGPDGTEKKTSFNDVF